MLWRCRRLLDWKNQLEQVRFAMEMINKRERLKLREVSNFRDR